MEADHLHSRRRVCTGLRKSFLVFSLLVASIWLPWSATGAAGREVPHVSRAPALAVATGKGMYLWQDGKARLLGPRQPAHLPAWSPNGRYLVWATGKYGTSLALWDSKTHRLASHPFTQLFAMAVNNNGIAYVTDGTYYYDVAHGKVHKIPQPSSDDYPSTAYPGGFFGVFLSGQTGQTGSQLVEFGSNGVDHTVRSLPSFPLSQPPLEGIWSDGSGAVIALEHGDHTDTCGAGPTSSLYVVRHRRQLNHYKLPAPPPGAVQRFWNVHFGPAGSIFVSVYECGTASSGFPMRVLELRSGKWRVVGDDLLAAAESSAGQLAVVRGHGVQTPNAITQELSVVPGPVLVAKKVLHAVPPVATDIAWRP